MEEKNLQPEEQKVNNLQDEPKSETMETQTPVVEEVVVNKETETEIVAEDNISADEKIDATELETVAADPIVTPVDTDVVDTTEIGSEKTSSVQVLTDDNELPATNNSEPAIADLLDPETDDEEDDDDEVEDYSDLLNAPEGHYNDFTREQLVEELEKLVQIEDVTSIKANVSRVKVAYLKFANEVFEDAENSTPPENTENVVAEEAKAETTEAAGTDENPEKDTVAEKVAPVDEENAKQDEDAKKASKEKKHTHKDLLADRFNAAFAIYRGKREKYLIALEEKKLTNLQEKKDILESLKVVISSNESLKKNYDDFRLLQDKWREIGMVPKTEVNNLWQTYHFLVEKFFDKVKINNELRDLDLKKNLEKKMQLCEAAEELILETSIIKSFKKLQELHQQWKETGPVPTDKKDELWDRFKNITEKINSRRREHYAVIRDDQETNYNAKLALCEQVEAIVQSDIKSIKEWQTKTDSTNEMLKVWKTIGPAPKTKNDEIWARFKGNLDAFFSKKKEFFSKLKDQQVNNYNLKLELCNEAESIKDSTDWRETSKTLIDMQKKWRTIGPVPKKYSDKIWKRFRAACDEFFNRKGEYFGHIHEKEGENLALKKDILLRIHAQEFSDKKDKNLSILKAFQREWMNVGHVPIKEKDAIQQEFNKAIDAKLDQLKINEIEINTMNFRNRVENLKDSSDSSRILSRERYQLQNRITKLQDDINLWENNIGFLAESKNANILKNEFEKKIQRAKQDVALLIAKMKYLDEQM